MGQQLLMTVSNRQNKKAHLIFGVKSGPNSKAKPYIWGQEEQPKPPFKQGGVSEPLPPNIRAYHDPKSQSFWIPAKEGWTRITTISAYLELDRKQPKSELSK